MSLNILTLCIGNICRSPIAEALLSRELPQCTISSAGLDALVGQGADPFSIQVAADHQLDIRSHRAQQVTLKMCQLSDVIFVMEQSHLDEIQNRFPFVRGKTFRIGHISRFDVTDPYRQSIDVFERCFTSIEKGVQEWLPRLNRL